MSEKSRYSYNFNVWIENIGFCNFNFQIANPNITVLNAFKRTVEASQNWDTQIPTTYRGREARWDFAYGAEGQAVEYIDPTRTFTELGIQPEGTITVGPIDVLGVGFVERIRFDRRQLIEFIDLNADLIEAVTISPRLFHLRLIGVRGITDLNEQGEPIFSGEHEFEIILGDDYPVRPPALRPRSLLFHPNVSMNDRKICGWVDWRADQEQILPWICFQVCDLIQYRKVNLEDPHRRMNLRASEWYEQQVRITPGMFPLSGRTFRGFVSYCRYCYKPLSRGSTLCPHCNREQ